MTVILGTSLKAHQYKSINDFDVITLAATGSEMNWGSVITNEETQQNIRFIAIILFPKYQSLIPKLQATVSRDYLVYSAADIIAHSIEAYFTAGNIVLKLLIS